MPGQHLTEEERKEFLVSTVGLEEEDAEEYAAKFKTNKISWGTLVDPTKDLLNEMGIVAVSEVIAILRICKSQKPKINININIYAYVAIIIRSYVTHSNQPWFADIVRKHYTVFTS